MDGSNYGAPNYGDYGCDLVYDGGDPVPNDCVIVSATSGYPLVGEELYCGCDEVPSYDFAPQIHPIVPTPLQVDLPPTHTNFDLTHSPGARSIRSSFSQDSLVTAENGCAVADQPSGVDAYADFLDPETREWMRDISDGPPSMDERRKTRVINPSSDFTTSSRRSRQQARDTGSPPETKPGHGPMAFTVDLGGGGLQIGEPIAKFIPKHRRNLSSSRASPDALKAHAAGEATRTPTKTSPETKTGRHEAPRDYHNESHAQNAEAIPPLSGPASFLLQRMFDIPGGGADKLQAQDLGLNDNDERHRNAEEYDHRVDEGSETGTYTIDKDCDEEDLEENEGCAEEPLMEGDVGGEEVEYEEGDDLVQDEGGEAVCEFEEDPQMWGSYEEYPQARMQAMPQVKPRVLEDPHRTPTRSAPKAHNKNSVVPADSRSSSSSSSPSKLSWSLESQSKPRRKLPLVPGVPDDPSGNDVMATSVTLDTECYLRDTETVMAAMQERVTRAQKGAAPLPPSSSCGPAPPRMKRKPDGPAGRLTTSVTGTSYSTQRASSLSREPPGGMYDRSKAESPREKSVSESTGSVRSEVSSVGSSGDASETGADLSTSSSIRKNRGFSLRRGRVESDQPEPLVRSMPPVQPGRSKASTTSTRPSSSGTKPALKPTLSSVGSHNRLSAGDGDQFARNDGGRHSLKLSRASPAPLSVPRQKRVPTAPTSSSGSKKPPIQSSSSTRSPNLVAGVNREEEYANWQRRKGYNPREAAAKGKINKNVPSRVTREVPKANSVMTQSAHESVKPYPTIETPSTREVQSTPYAVLKSASFHGSEGMMESQRIRRRTKPQAPAVPVGAPAPARPQTYTASSSRAPILEVDRISDQEVVSPVSPVEFYPGSVIGAVGAAERAPPMSAHRPRSQDEEAYVPGRHRFDMENSYKHAEQIVDHTHGAGAASWTAHGVNTVVPHQLESPRAAGPKSPLRTVPGAPQPGGKLEALDSLVISAVFSLSARLTDKAKRVLEKLKCQVSDETDVASKLEDLLLLMDRADSATSPTGGPGSSSTGGKQSSIIRSSSKDLSGTLKNLRRLEQVMTLVDEVLSMDPTAEDYDSQYDSMGHEHQSDFGAGAGYDLGGNSLQSYNGYHGGY